MTNVVDIFIGSTVGNLKGVNLSENSFNNLNTVQTSDRSQEIVSLCFTNSSNQSDETEILCGLISRQLKLYDTVSSSYTHLFTAEGGQGKICGLEVVETNVLTCVESGLVKLWSLDGIDKKLDFNAGPNLCRMRKSITNQNLIATGGKENPLKVWDMQKPSAPIFASKNVKNNFLDLRTPVWDTDLRFLSDSDSNLVATCTGHHFIRLYDLRTAGRRPSLQINWEQDPFTAMSSCRHEKQVVAGTNRGFMGLFDLRSPGKLVHAYKGFAGHINSIEAHPAQPYIASCGLDRFFHLHDLDSKKILHKIYCKTHLNTLLMKKNLSISTVPSSANSIKTEIETNVDDAKQNSDDDEEFWSDMSEIREDVKKKRRTTPAGDSEDIKRKCLKNLKKRQVSDDENEKIVKISPAIKRKKSNKSRLELTKKRKNSSDDESTKTCLTGLKSKLKKRKMKLK